MKNNIRWRVGFHSLVMLTILLVAACGQEGKVLAPTEEEQIKNVAVGYFARDPNIPEYEAQIEAVIDDWARVSLSPVAVESTDEPIIIYLQNQAQTDGPVPAAESLVSGTNDAEIATDLGWVVITPPQARFSDEELDSMGIPEKIRR